MARPYSPKPGIGPKFMEDRCAAAVHSKYLGIRQCKNKATVREPYEGVEYGWCGLHAPSAVARRKDQQDRYWREKLEAERVARERAAQLRKANEAARKALEEIAAGHNDPRALAQQALAMYPDK